MKDTVINTNAQGRAVEMLKGILGKDATLTLEQIAGAQAHIEANDKALALAAQSKTAMLGCSVGPSGCISISGFGNFPKNFFTDELDRFLAPEFIVKLRAFQKEQEALGNLSHKGVEYKPTAELRAAWAAKEAKRNAK